MARRWWWGRVARIALALLALYLATGYFSTRLSWVPTSSAPGASAAAPWAGAEKVHVAGAVHVHSGRSHDAIGTEDEVLAAARAAGLDFVLLSDHRSGSAPREEWEVPARYGDGVLLVRGQEVPLVGQGRVLTFGLDTVLTRWEAGLDGFARVLELDGATAIVAHPRSPRVRDSWRPSGTPGIAGWEVFDLADVGRERLRGPWALYHLVALAAGAPVGRTNRSLIGLFREGFDGSAVAAYDSLYRDYDLTALAGLDAHPKARLLGGLLPSYDAYFGSLIDHLVLRVPLPGDPVQATNRLAEAIAMGSAYVSFGDADDARDFRLRVGAIDRSWVGIGAALDWRPGLTLAAGFADGAEGRLVYRVIRDGESIAWVRGAALRWTLGEAGAYRVEVYRYTLRIGPLFWRLRPWIFANPNRVGAAAAR